MNVSILPVKEQSRARAINSLLHPKPDMSLGNLPRSNVLAQVEKMANGLNNVGC